MASICSLFPITQAFFRLPDFPISRFSTPPPIALLLKTKAKPHFDRTVTDRSKSLFSLVSTSNPVASRICSGQPLVWCLRNSFTTIYFFKNLLNRGGPEERLGLTVGFCR